MGDSTACLWTRLLFVFGFACRGNVPVSFCADCEFVHKCAHMGCVSGGEVFEDLLGAISGFFSVAHRSLQSQCFFVQSCRHYFPLLPESLKVTNIYFISIFSPKNFGCLFVSKSKKTFTRANFSRIIVLKPAFVFTSSALYPTTSRFLLFAI